MGRFTRMQRHYLWLGLAGGFAAAVYFALDPAAHGWMPKCLFHTLTGYECPGCGSQRMLHALLHGDLAGAWRFNAFLLCSLPLLALYVYADLHPGRLNRLLYHPVLVTSYVLLLAAWAIGRNLIN